MLQNAPQTPSFTTFIPRFVLLLSNTCIFSTFRPLCFHFSSTFFNFVSTYLPNFCSYSVHFFTSFRPILFNFLSSSAHQLTPFLKRKILPPTLLRILTFWQLWTVGRGTLKRGDSRERRQKGRTTGY